MPQIFKENVGTANSPNELKYADITPVFFKKIDSKKRIIDPLVFWVFVFPGPGPYLYITAPVPNLYFTTPALNLYLPAPTLKLCLPVLRFTVKVSYSYNVY